MNKKLKTLVTTMIILMITARIAVELFISLDFNTAMMYMLLWVGAVVILLSIFFIIKAIVNWIKEKTLDINVAVAKGIIDD